MTIDNFLRDSAIISRKSCIFDLWSKIGCIGNTKKNMFSFGISLDLHYLCTQKACEAAHARQFKLV